MRLTSIPPPVAREEACGCGPERTEVERVAGAQGQKPQVEVEAEGLALQQERGQVVLESGAD